MVGGLNDRRFQLLSLQPQLAFEYVKIPLE